MTLTTGSGRFDLALPEGHATPELPVWYHLPANPAPGRPIVIVLHGTSRAARASRDNWAGHAEAGGFTVAVPEFELAPFPNPAYAYANLWQEEPPHERFGWEASYGRFIDLLFDQLREESGSTEEQFTLYGHSAGAAFAHRYVLFAPIDRTSQAIIANSGWYTLLDPALPLPFGIGNADLSNDRLRAFLGKQLTVLVGDRDRSGPYPGWWPEGCRFQGEHRVARSLTWFEGARRLAERLETPFNWHWQSVPEVAHENAKMIAPAVGIITGVALPGAAQ